ncbi:MAG: outer membrane beta-barrel domain-containing protein [Deltaproteobacteria bacterium]|nr:outer membrane beta-barrel domain-containing protein [Deltaproteobacteria bacterium]
MSPSMTLEPMRRFAIPLLTLAMAVAPAAGWAADAEKKAEKEAEEAAQEKRPSLADKIAPVSGNLFLKSGRFEITPNVGFSLGDAFFQKYAFGLKLNYHLAESISVGLHGAYALATPGGAVSVCRSDGCRSPEMDDLQNVPGKVSMLAGLELGFSPIYGKVNVIAEKVLHFDIAVVGGIDLVNYAAPVGQGTFTVGGHLGLGQRFFITPSVTLRVELRDYIYSGKTVQLSDSDSKVENQLMLDIGVSFFLGGSKE